MKKTVDTYRDVEMWSRMIQVLRHGRNLHELGPHPFRALCTDVEVQVEKYLGPDYDPAVKMMMKRNKK